MSRLLSKREERKKYRRQRKMSFKETIDKYMCDIKVNDINKSFVMREYMLEKKDKLFILQFFAFLLTYQSH